MRFDRVEGVKRVRERTKTMEWSETEKDAQGLGGVRNDGELNSGEGSLLRPRGCRAGGEV